MMTKNGVGRLLVVVGLLSASGALVTGAALAENAAPAPVRAEVAQVVPTFDLIVSRQSRLGVALAPDSRLKLKAAARELATRIDRPAPRTVRAKTPIEHARELAGSPAYTGLGTVTGVDIEDLAILIMVEAAMDAQDDVAALLAQMKSTNDAKKRMRDYLAEMKKRRTTSSRDMFLGDAGTSDSLTELSESQQMRLMQQLDRLAKLELMLSSVLKKASDTQAGIIANMK